MICLKTLGVINVMVYCYCPVFRSSVPVRAISKPFLITLSALQLLGF